MRPSIENSVKGSDSRPQGVQLRLENARNKQHLLNSRPLSRDRHIIKVLLVALKVHATLGACDEKTQASEAEAESTPLYLRMHEPSEWDRTLHGNSESNRSLKENWEDYGYQRLPEDSRKKFYRCEKHMHPKHEYDAFKFISSSKNQQCFLHIVKCLVAELSPRFIDYCTDKYFEKTRQKIVDRILKDTYEFDYELLDTKIYCDDVIFEVLRSFGIPVHGIPIAQELLDARPDMKYKVQGFPTRNRRTDNKLNKLESATRKMKTEFNTDYESEDPKYPAYIFYDGRHWYCMIWHLSKVKDELKPVWSLYDNQGSELSEFRTGQVLEPNDVKNFFFEEICTRPGKKRYFEAREGFWSAIHIFRVPKVGEVDHDALLADCKTLLTTEFPEEIVDPRLTWKMIQTRRATESSPPKEE